MLVPKVSTGSIWCKISSIVSSFVYHLLVPNAAVFTEGQLGLNLPSSGLGCTSAAANGDLERGTGGRDQGGSLCDSWFIWSNQLTLQEPTLPSRERSHGTRPWEETENHGKSKCAGLGIVDMLVPRRPRTSSSRSRIFLRPSKWQATWIWKNSFETSGCWDASLMCLCFFLEHLW